MNCMRRFHTVSIPLCSGLLVSLPDSSLIASWFGAFGFRAHFSEADLPDYLHGLRGQESKGGGEPELGI